MQRSSSLRVDGLVVMGEVDGADASAALGYDLVGQVDSVGDQAHGENGHQDVGGNVSVPALLTKSYSRYTH